jgi:hypothetical protein
MNTIDTNKGIEIGTVSNNTLSTTNHPNLLPIEIFPWTKLTAFLLDIPNINLLNY